VPWGAVVKILKSAEPHAPFDPDAPCRAGETGHIWINTPALMQGYHRQPELTAQVISGGWFYTGDIGLVDDRGWLYLKGREREEINKGGTKIYPADIDAVVEQFRADQRGLRSPRPIRYTVKISLAVVLKDETRDDPGAARLMKRRLAEFKCRCAGTRSTPAAKLARQISRKEVAERCAQKAVGSREYLAR
jgi:rifamycin polyketide synthase module 1/2/3